MLYYALLLVFILEYVRPIRYLPFLYPLHLSTIIPVGVAYFSTRNNQAILNIDFLKLSNTKMILILLGLMGAGVLWVEVHYYTFLKFVTVFGYFLIYYSIIKNVNGRKGIDGILIVISLCHMVLLILTPDVILHPEVRTYLEHESFLGDGNDFALSLNIVIPYCIYLYSRSKSKSKKLFFLFLTAIFVLAVIGTSSRGGSVALAAVLFYQWLKSRNKMLGLAGLAVVILLVLAYAPANYFERMGTIQNYESEGSAQGRISVWKSAIRMAVDHPLTGVGAGHFGLYRGTKYQPPEVGQSPVRWSTAHSVYFLVLGELGFPGLAVIICLIVVNLVRNGRIIRSSSVNKASGSSLPDRQLFICLNSSLIGFAVGGAFLSAAYYPHLYILAGLMEAGRHTYQREQKNGENGLLPVTH